MKILPLRWIRYIYDLFNPEDSIVLATQKGGFALQRKNQFFEYLTILSEQRGYAYAGNRSLAQKFGVSTRTIQRWIKTLDESGLITVEHRRKYRRIYIGAKRQKERHSSRHGRNSDMAGRQNVVMKRQNVVPDISSRLTPDSAQYCLKGQMELEIPPDYTAREVVSRLWGEG